jgi:hypothetical protein
LSNASTPADSNLNLKSSNVWVEIFVVRGCTSRPRWRCPASRIKYHEKCGGLPIWGRDAPVSARVIGDRSTRVLEMRSVERPDGFDYGGATLVERVGDRIGILVSRAYSLPVFFPALHQRVGFGRYRRRHR